MQKIRKIYRAVFREKRGRETDRETERQRETDPNIRVLRTLSLSRRKWEKSKTLEHKVILKIIQAVSRNNQVFKRFYKEISHFSFTVVLNILF